MSIHYQAVGWNRQKKIYDLVLWMGIILFFGIFTLVHALVNPNATAETSLIRGLGVTAFVMLHLILCIGPLCRLNPIFLPLLYNRRHFGVSMFLIALVHGLFSMIQFHALGDTNPIFSLFTSNLAYQSLSQFPFQVLGFIALILLFLMAATSHDFWLAHLSAPVWKTLHMGVYLAYLALVGHVVLGILQAETQPALAGLTMVGAFFVFGLHLAAGFKELKADRNKETTGFVDVCAVSDIEPNRAVLFCGSGERIAVFRYDNKISAVSNVCQHQNGPLAEGKIIDGCITCPWHGYQYKPEDGSSPPPFTEKVPTFRVKVEQGRVLVDPRPLPPGKKVEPAVFEGAP